MCQVSQPYVDMTVKIMERFGVTVHRLDGLQHMKVGGMEWGGGEMGRRWRVCAQLCGLTVACQ